MTNEHESDPIVEGTPGFDHEPVDGGIDPYVDVEPPASKWPKVIGIIAIIYASLGLFCQVGSVGMTYLSPMLMQMGGIEIEMPPQMLMMVSASAVVLSIVGIILLVGGIKLVRRRRAAIPLLKTWAILRLFLVVLGIVVGVLMMPMNLAFQEAIQEATNDRMREAGRPEMVREFNEDAKYTQVIITTAVTAAFQAALPLFLGLYLSRRSVTEEVDQWA